MLPSLCLRSDSSKPPLRVGLLLDSAELTSCFAEVVDHIQQSNFANLELLVFNAESQGEADVPAPRKSPIRKIIDLLTDTPRRKTLLYALYQRWDRRNIVASKDPHAPVDCTARFAGIDSIQVTPIRKRFVHRIQPEDIERIREKHLDVLIRFGFNILRGDILTVARYGVWSYHHGDGDYYRGGPAHFWEVVEGNPISGVMLQVLTEELDAGKVLCKGLFATRPGISRAMNCVQPYWGATTFVIQKLHDLHQYGWEHVDRTAVTKGPYYGKKKIYIAPTNGEMVSWLAPLLLRKAFGRLLRRPATKHWRMAIRSGASLLAASTDLTGFRWLESPKGRFYADPFMIEEGGKTWVFFEDLDYSTDLGRISCAEVHNGAISNVLPVLERPYHLSYPCIFRVDGQMYMIPETGSNGTVELYRCEHFPDKWALEKVLFNGKAVDTTVWIEDGTFWFFVTLQESRANGAQLWLFSATTLTGAWTPHPANPISMDVRNARGAGAIFRHDGKLYRPSQDCSQHYGYSFTFNEIVVLDTDRYEEKPCQTVNPVWAEGLVATHSYSRAGQVEIIDGCVPFPTGKV